MLASAVFVSACSGSSNTPSSVQTGAIVNEQTNSSENNPQESNPVEINPTSGGSVLNQLQGDATETQMSDATVSSEGDALPIDADLSIRALTQVNFDVTVPAYVSTALKVELALGEQAIPVSWVGDEFWFASGELPSDTEHALLVTFYDNNGELTLGTVNTTFKTGTNPLDSIQITADQFDTEKWDNDGDGVSNLEESIVGTNPMLDDTVQLEVRTSLDFSQIGYYSLSSFEPLVPAERPYFIHNETDSGSWTYPGGPIIPGDTTLNTVDIDVTGTGSYFYESVDYSINDQTIYRHEGTRTTAENSIAWQGMRFWSNADSGKSETNRFDLETTLLSNAQRRISGVISLPNSAFGETNPEEYTFSLVGDLIEGTERCAPVSGTVTRTQTARYSSRPLSNITVTKSLEDRYWTVTPIAADSDAPVEGIAADPSENQAYLVLSIGTTFLCEFTEWENR